MNVRDRMAVAIDTHSKCFPLAGTADPSCGMPAPEHAPGAADWKTAHLADAAALAVVVDPEAFGNAVEPIDAALRARPYAQHRHEMAYEALQDALRTLGLSAP